MPLASSRLGFWNIGQEDRSVVKSKNVLIVYDLNSIRAGVYSDPNPDPSSLAAVISARETSLGFIPTTVTSYSSFLALTPSQIADFAHIWDVGYDTLIPGNVEDSYAEYLNGGGAMFLLGENGNFVIRNGDLTNFITNMGGGTISTTNQTTGIITATIAPEFLLANSNSIVTFNNVGRFNAFGTGTVMASSSNGIHAAVWKTGSLSNKPTGAIAVVLDINFLVPPDTQPDFIDNVSIVLNKT
jgi:hypothetical protein